ncbi:hypothetical protein ATE49_15285 [Elizabethkingia miricola]|uniref:Lipoprotein n=1 Tax=Elizabethkingia miricola TaxID=172045 RepID=A0ABY3NB16_ELIMR|nr:hypothetical protein [Elizabethkingia miricola]OBS12817.1 hypothetical protein ATE49_15285 [Elizabethkingia miricola]TYO84785.1 hypothetical protein LX74_03845 [Elizabethkingia miricola]TYO91703.1 hypothetical protein LX74_01947 [Elizabethkingia miricola]
MTKNLLKASLWGILTVSLFYSCRTDSATTEQTVASKEKIAAFERFEKQNNIALPLAGTKQASAPQRYISYAKPFAEIISNFIQNHPDYAKWMDKSVGVIRLDVASQTFGEDKKAVIFPVTDESGKVTGAWYGIINEERSYVNFSYMNDNSIELADIKKAFQNYYDKKTGSLSSRAVASTSKLINPVALKNGNEQKPIDIEEVVITKKNPTTPPPDQWVPKYPDEPSGGGGPGTGMSGGTGTHGGGTTTTDPNKKDPCSQMKSKIATEKGREIIKDLEAKAKTPGAGETAYRQNKVGDPTMYQGEQDNVLIPIDNNMEGVYHNHPDGGILMLSVKDIRMLLFAARMQSDDNVGNAFVGMISNRGNYFINFSGTKADIPVIYDNQVDGFRDSYNDLYTGMQMYIPNGEKEVTSEQLERLFFETIKEMGLEGKVNLIKEKDGNTSVIKQDANGKPVTSNPC